MVISSVPMREEDSLLLKKAFRLLLHGKDEIAFSSFTVLSLPSTVEFIL